MLAKILRIRGQVQGVFFRESLRQEAGKYGIVGWVRNRQDGSVEAFLQGDPQRIKPVMEWCRHGPPASRVTMVEESDAEIDFSLANFSRKETV